MINPIIKEFLSQALATIIKLCYALEGIEEALEEARKWLRNNEIQKS